MCDDNREVDEQSEELRVGVLTLGARRGFVYKLSWYKSCYNACFVCKCETCQCFV